MDTVFDAGDPFPARTRARGRLLLFFAHMAPHVYSRWIRWTPRRSLTTTGMRARLRAARIANGPRVARSSSMTLGRRSAMRSRGFPADRAWTSARRHDSHLHLSRRRRVVGLVQGEILSGIGDHLRNSYRYREALVVGAGEAEEGAIRRCRSTRVRTWPFQDSGTCFIASVTRCKNQPRATPQASSRISQYSG